MFKAFRQIKEQFSDLNSRTITDVLLTENY